MFALTSSQEKYRQVDRGSEASSTDQSRKLSHCWVYSTHDNVLSKNPSNADKSSLIKQENLGSQGSDAV